MAPDIQLVDRDVFIAAMRGVASTVTVVTTDGPAGRHGCTVSAFSSVSADPPSVLVCLNASNRITPMILQNGGFTVNILPDDAVEIAARFAGAHDADFPDRFTGIALAEASRSGLACATALHCTTAQTMTAGSHEIVVGHVHDINGQAGLPLAYLDGAFHQVTPKVRTR